jgi:LysM repeat protein
MELYRIPASITLAQGMIESGCGKSKLAVETNNHFGIKCQKEWTGEKYYYDDDEKNECFRVYKNVSESYRDHSIFLSTRSRYASLFALSVYDYKGWATGLKKAGYATNPEYANILIRLIETNKLNLLDDSTNFRKKEIAQENITIQPIKKTDNINEAVSTRVVKEGRIIYRKGYKFPIPDHFEYEYTSDEGRKVYENNGVPFIFVKKGDTWYGIAKEFGIFSKQLYKQNDLFETDIISPGQMLYLEPKKKKNKDSVYVVKGSDSLYSISQEKGVRLAQLLKYNKLKEGDEPQAGYELKLSR